MIFLIIHKSAFARLTHNQNLKIQSWWAELISFASLPTISGTFNSLFKVLFTFPSQYLYAIGLKPVISFRWNLPPTLCSIPKEHDSLKTSRTTGITMKHGILTLNDAFSKELTSLFLSGYAPQDYNLMTKHQFSAWAYSSSVALTKEIPFGFFSTA